MEQKPSLKEEFLLAFEAEGAPRYPEELLQKYEPIECLANNQMGETLLVRDKANVPYVVKCYTNPALLSKTTEGDLLKNLRHEGLPAFVEEIQADGMLCVVRAYVRGTPLSRAHKALSKEQAVGVALQLCDVLAYLHSRTPPIIHRDIKPQNVIIGEDGQATLIDFGISRAYVEGARADTVSFGTQEFAPPEQYGFAQTDGRADIYSLGVLLGWMLTGRTNEFAIADRRLARIVKKCTAFSPRDRYANVAALKRALHNADGHAERLALKIAALALAGVALVAGGFALGRFTNVRPPLFYDVSAAAIRDPVLKKAIRQQAGKAEGEALTAEDVRAITELYVYGDQTVGSWEVFNQLRSDVFSENSMLGEETVTSLDDLKKTPNLIRLALGYTNVQDLSVLGELSGLELLELHHCPAKDFSPIGRLTNLRHLIVQDCANLEDISFLSGCPNLRELVVMSNGPIEDYSALSALDELQYLHLEGADPALFVPYLMGKTVHQLKIGWNSIDSLAALDGIAGLEELICYGMNFNTLDGGERLTNLKRLEIHASNGGENIDLAPLLRLPALETLTLSENLRPAAEAALAGAPFSIIFE